MLKKYSDWWLKGIPLPPGWLQFIFYAGLWILAFQHSKSPFLALELYEGTAPEFYFNYGILHTLGIGRISPGILSAIVWIVKISWIAAALGLFSPVSKTVTALGFFFLHGMFYSVTSLNHTWFLPMYALIAMALIQVKDPWTVDYHLEKWRKGKVKPLREDSFFRSSFGLKVLLVLVVAFYFSAGVSKMADSGIKWMDGNTLSYSILLKDRPINLLLGPNIPFCIVISILTILLEFGVILTLFFKRTRLPLLLGISFMHLGINIIMGPWYFGNIWIFMLLIDWREEYGAWKHLLRKIFRRKKSPNPASQPASPVTYRGTKAGVFAGSLLLAALACIITFHFEYWPLTPVDMFSAYFDKDVYAEYPRNWYQEMPGVQQIARDCHAGKSTRHAGKYLGYRAVAYLTKPDGTEYRLTRGVGVTSSKQWYKMIVAPAVIDDLAIKPDNQIQFRPDHPDDPAQALLRKMLPVVKREVPGINQFQKLKLEMRINGPNPVIAEVDIW